MEQKLRKTTRQKVKESNDPLIEDMGTELDTFIALDALSLTDGGKILIKSLTKDIISTVESLCMKYPELTQTQFIAYSAKMKEKLDILRTLTRANKNKSILTEEIEKLLEETLQD